MSEKKIGNDQVKYGRTRKDSQTKLRPKGHEETMEEKQRRWFLRDAEQYLGQLRHALFREDWAASRQQCGEILDLIDRREGGRP